MPIQINRSGTVRGSNSDGTLKMGTKGMSEPEIQRYRYDQYNTVINPFKDEARNIAFLQKKDRLFNQWNLEQNTGTNTESFAEFAARHSLDRGGKHRRRPSRKYKKSKRVFRKKSRSTRRR